MNSIQSQINRLRSEQSRLVNERNQARQELQQVKNQWENIDRPRLLNMLFTPENQDSVRNGTLTQILDKFQNEVLNPGNQGDPIKDQDLIQDQVNNMEYHQKEK